MHAGCPFRAFSGSTLLDRRRCGGSYYFNHKTLELLFYEAGAVGDVPEGNCVTKCESWLKRMHKEVPAPAVVLGKVLEKFMEVDEGFRLDQQEAGRKRV